MSDVAGCRQRRWSRNRSRSWSHVVSRSVASHPGESGRLDTEGLNVTFTVALDYGAGMMNARRKAPPAGPPQPPAGFRPPGRTSPLDDRGASEPGSAVLAAGAASLGRLVVCVFWGTPRPPAGRASPPGPPIARLSRYSPTSACCGFLVAGSFVVSRWLGSVLGWWRCLLCRSCPVCCLVVVGGPGRLQLGRLGCRSRLLWTVFGWL